MAKPVHKQDRAVVPRSLAAILAANASYFGIVSAETGPVTASINIGTDNGLSATNFVAYAYNGSATATVLLGAADTDVHTWRIISDATTVSFWRDGTQVGTLATNVANFPTGLGSPGLYSTVGATGQALYKVLYSFVGP
jgi:hypothetical protein